MTLIIAGLGVQTDPNPGVEAGGHGVQQPH